MTVYISGCFVCTSCRKDRKMYIACYKELAEKLPGPPTALLLGDAYMNIQEVYYRVEGRQVKVIAASEEFSWMMVPSSFTVYMCGV